VLAAAAILYFTIAGKVGRPGVGKVAQEAAAEKTGSDSSAPESSAKIAPLVLEVPADKPLSSDVYVVTEGDTLWGIAERFTGNPFNFPRLAGENRIVNPDLIFPGQKIYLVK
jgi:nucleoid-associated protein YgaU